jgi:hypothetical protein
LIDQITKLISKYTAIQKVAVCSVYFGSEKELLITVSIALLKRSKFTLQSRENFLEVAHAIESIPKDVPVICHFDGVTVLHRKVKKTAAHSVREYLTMIIPNAQREDFYCQYVSSSPVDGFFSLAAKHEIDPLIVQLKVSGRTLVDIALGPFFIDHALPLFPAETSSVVVRGYALTIGDGHVIDFLKTNRNGGDSLKFGNVLIEADDVIPYLLALLFCLKANREVDFIAPEFLNAKIDFTYHVVTRYLVRFAVLPLLILAVMLFGFYSYVVDENEELTYIFNDAWKEKTSFDTLVRDEQIRNA